ncbi:hypothetical protein [Bradyrhizobium sp. CCGUVB23]|uniref:hypothetical protein n=1 Tax=Bradyrhizobium sp. CCGUVB23 TaxID=2949630 RepID=UPI003531C92A
MTIPKLDDLVLLLIQAGGFHVEQDSYLTALTVGSSECLPTNQAPKDAIVGGFGQCLGHGGEG